MTAPVERWQAVESFLVRLGYGLRLLRIERGLTPEQLAVKIGAPVEIIKLVERGDWPDANMRLIADMAWALDGEINFDLLTAERGGQRA